MKMTITSSVLLIVSIAIVCFSTCCQNREGKSVVQSETSREFINVAKEYLKLQGVSTEGLNGYFDKDNEKWNQLFQYIQQQSETDKMNYTEELKTLDNVDYQAVSFEPADHLTLGGIYWVFIDKNSMQAIHHFGMK